MNEEDKFLYDYRKDPPSEVVEALWQKLSAQEQCRPASRVGFYTKLAMVGLILTLILFITTPPMRALAQDVLQFFVQASQDTFLINLTFDDPAAPQIDFADITPPADVDVDVIEESGTHNLAPDFVYPTLTEARKQTTLPIKAPVNLPEGYTLFRALVRMGSPLVTLVYSKDGSPVLALHQRRITSEKPTAHVEVYIETGAVITNSYNTNLQIDIAFGEVSPDATIKPVQIGDVQGEYVRGAWEIDPYSLTNKMVSPGATISVTPVWNPNAPGQMLRWQTDNTLFEIIASDESLNLSDLITIATSIE